MRTPDDQTLLRANLWCGEPAIGAVARDVLKWAFRRNLHEVPQFLAPAETNLDDWTDPRVGWGVVLPDRDDVPAADKARGADAPEPIRRLIAARGNAPVFRYRPDLRRGQLRRYAADGTPSDPSLRGKHGTADNAVPYYLLLVGSPTEIPWDMQCRLQMEAFVGRLDLDAAGLERYVNALLDGWTGAQRNVRLPVIWSVDHGYPDITRLMRKTIAEPLRGRFAADAEFDIGEGFFADAQATHAALIDALARRNPAFIVTTSHGATFPLDRPEQMRAQLGLPVDHQQTLTDAAAYADGWNPLGAVWYAHACCSAGCDASSRFAGLVDETSTLGRALASIATIGACTAPLPRVLLGGPHPLGCFIGHVEPTFDWTLRDPETGQVTTQPIVDTLYAQLHLAGRPPVGRAMHLYFRHVAGLLHDYVRAIEAVDHHAEGAPQRAKYAKLIATDCQAMVVLGDPTIALPRTA